MIVVEWKLTTFLRQEPWLDAPPRTRGVARLRAALRTLSLIQPVTQMAVYLNRFLGYDTN